MSVRGKGVRNKTSGKNQGDERKQTTDDASKDFRRCQNQVSTRPGGKKNSRETPQLLEWHPAWRWRDLDTGSHVEREKMRCDAKAKVTSGEPTRAKRQKRNVESDSLIVAKKSL